MSQFDNELKFLRHVYDALNIPLKIFFQQTYESPGEIPSEYILSICQSCNGSITCSECSVCGAKLCPECTRRCNTQNKTFCIIHFQTCPFCSINCSCERCKIFSADNLCETCCDNDKDNHSCGCVTAKKKNRCVSCGRKIDILTKQRMTEE